MMTIESEDQTTASWMKEAQKGYIRMGLLILINKKPAHGYEIMKEINNRTQGFWRPTPGGVYPILRDLEKSGYLKGHWETQKNRKLKVYKITKSGQAILRRAIVKQAEISSNISNLFREFARDVLNIEKDTQLPEIPSMFSAFLDEKSEGAQTLERLERHRRHAIEGMKKMREELKELDKKISQLKTNSTSSKSTSN